MMIYNLLYFFALLAYLPVEIHKRPTALRERWVRERCGLLKKRHIADDKEQKPVWIHAVSVGEVIAAAPLIRRLKEAHPDHQIVLSTVTDTGQKVANERVGDIASIIYMPFDLPFAVRNALKNIHPSVFIIMETELWPNVIRILKKRHVPVLLMNGRISDRSFKGYMKIRFFMHRVLNNFSVLCMQNDLYAERVRQLGAPSEKVKILGSFKFDINPSSPLPEWTKALKGQTMIAGSTHRTEEELVLGAYAELKKEFQGLNLIIAPRHPERFREVEEIIRKKGFDVMKRSEIKADEVAGIIILDAMGELSSVYGAADIAIMGGSFIEHGGQNPLEPAFWAKTIVCGPHMENFPFMEEFYEKGGALKVEASDLFSALRDLLKSPERMALMGRIARGLYEKNAGATERALEIIKGYL